MNVVNYNWYRHLHNTLTLEIQIDKKSNIVLKLIQIKEKREIIGSKCSISVIFHHFQYLKQPPFQYYPFSTNDQTFSGLSPALHTAELSSILSTNFVNNRMSLRQQSLVVLGSPIASPKAPRKLLK